MPITPDNCVFVVLSFEGPDNYSMAGGLSVRVTNLALTLAEMGFPTHLFFVGDPGSKGEEAKCGGKLVLHRWCQWISQYYPAGVYQGENEKLYDFNESLPWFIRDRILRSAIQEGKIVAVLAEEWHTAEAVCRLSEILTADGLRDRVLLFWNANNTFSFDRIDWKRLSNTATVTTVSRYMKHTMWPMGLNPIVIYNGIPKALFQRLKEEDVGKVRAAVNADLLLCKVARWDPAKGWEAAVETVHRLKEKGHKVKLLARGGLEGYGGEILHRARASGLQVGEATAKNSPFSYLEAIQEANSADIINIKFPLPLDFLRILYRASDAVLANSGHEPFGLVALEAMASGGIAFTGSTGEDYAISLINSFVLDTSDALEIVGYLNYLQAHPHETCRIRRAARVTARAFTWESVARILVSKLECQARVQGLLHAAHDRTFGPEVSSREVHGSV